MDPPSIKVLLHERPEDRGSWSPHALSGWYIVPSLEHYHCHPNLMATIVLKTGDDVPSWEGVWRPWSTIFRAFMKKNFDTGWSHGSAFIVEIAKTCAWEDNLGLIREGRRKLRLMTDWATNFHHKLRGKFGSVEHKPAMKWFWNFNFTLIPIASMNTSRC